MSPRKDGGERRALVIANGLYDDTTIRHLPAQQADAEKLAALLGDPSIGGFETETCVNKTSSEIRKAMGKLFHRRGREDLILVYYSGHGFKDDWGHLHLSSRDTDAELFASTCIDAAWLTRQIDCCAARKIVIILDCCYSGAYMSAPMLGEDLVDLHGAFSGDGSGRVVLSASSKVQLAYESVFTRYLVEGIETGAADSNGDGEIDVDELFEYLQERIKRENGRQTPQKFELAREGKLCVARAQLPTTIGERWVIEVVDVPRGEKRFVELSDREMTVGRRADSTIFLDDGKVGRTHAKILCREDAVYIVDLDSKQGTFVDGQRITGETLLSPSTRVQIVQTTLRLVSTDASAGPVANPGVTTLSRSPPPQRAKPTVFDPT